MLLLLFLHLLWVSGLLAFWLWCCGAFSKNIPNKRRWRRRRTRQGKQITRRGGGVAKLPTTRNRRTDVKHKCQKSCYLAFCSVCLDVQVLFVFFFFCVVLVILIVVLFLLVVLLSFFLWFSCHIHWLLLFWLLLHDVFLSDVLCCYFYGHILDVLIFGYVPHIIKAKLFKSYSGGPCCKKYFKVRKVVKAFRVLGGVQKISCKRNIFQRHNLHSCLASPFKMTISKVTPVAKQMLVTRVSILQSKSDPQTGH